MPAARDGRPRTPQGWKVLKGEAYCRACKQTSYSLRAVIAESCRTYAAHLASHVTATGAREVRYDDRVRPDLLHFPWELLRRRVAQKLDERGIRFVYVPVETGRDGEHAA